MVYSAAEPPQEYDAWLSLSKIKFYGPTFSKEGWCRWCCKEAYGVEFRTSVGL